MFLLTLKKSTSLFDMTSLKKKKKQNQKRTKLSWEDIPPSALNTYFTFEKNKVKTMINSQ